MASMSSEDAEQIFLPYFFSFLSNFFFLFCIIHSQLELGLAGAALKFEHKNDHFIKCAALKFEHINEHFIKCAHNLKKL